MQSVLDEIEKNDHAAIETARQEYRNAIVDGTVDSSPAESVAQWLKLLKLTTGEIRADQAAQWQLNLLESELPTNETTAQAATDQRAALDRLDELKLEQLTMLTAAENELNKATNRRNHLAYKTKQTTQQIEKLKRDHPRID